MTVSCKLYIRARISRAKFRQILRLFALDLTAFQIAEITNLNRNTINRYLTLTRSLIAALCEQESPFSGAVECDESYLRLWSSKRQTWSRGRKQTHRLRHLQKKRTCLYRDCQKRESQDFTANYQRSCQLWFNRLYRWFPFLWFDCSSWLSKALSHLSPGKLRQRRCPYQRHRRFLGICQSETRQVSRAVKEHFLFALERVRV